VEQYKVSFESIPWEMPADGVKFKAYKQNGRKLRLAEFSKEFTEPDWYTKGHIDIGLMEENEEKYWQLIGRIACGNGGNTLSIVTITSMDPNDKDWMVSTFNSISYPDPKP